jgi:uncharacterized protein with FMN-binding domain
MDETPIQPIQKKSNTNIIIAIILIAGVLLVALYYGVLRNVKKEDIALPIATDTSSDTVNTVTDTNNQTVTPPTPQFIYKNGTYNTIGNYVSPGGAEEIDVTVTLKDDIITDATVVSKAFRPNSVKFQGQFISGFKTLVVGKKIDDVMLDKVSGSSLTPKGFNDALAEIKAEAKV